MKLGWLALGAVVLGCSSQQGTRGPVVEDRTELPKEERVEAFEESSADDRAVGYHNPKTGYSSEYGLDVEVDDEGNVERIYFPNGGYEDDFVSQENNGDGTATVTDEDGREWTVEVPELGGDEE